MALNIKNVDDKHFVINRSEINTSKLFVEFYSPKYKILLSSLDQGKYPTCHLKSICNRMFDGPFGSNRKVDMYQSNGIPYVRVKQVQHEGIDTTDLVYISPQKHQDIIRSRVIPGNVLLTIAGSRLGKAAVFPSIFEEGNITGHIAGIEVAENINPYYLALYINSRFGEAQIARLSHRSTRKELNLKEVGQIIVPVPPRALQDQIAQTIQEAYSDRQKKLEEAKTSFLGIEAYVHQTLDVTRDLPIDEPRFLVSQSQLHRWDVRFFLPSFSGLEDFIEKGKYPTKSLLSVCEKITNGLTPAKIGYTDEGCVVVKVASLTKLFQINWGKVAFTSTEFFKKAKKAHIKDGDLLILSASHQLDYIGRSFALVRDIPADYIDQCMAVGELILIRSNPQIVLPEYLLALVD